MASQPNVLPAFHPHIALRDWPAGQAFRIGDALTGVIVFGGTGSGKTSGPAKHLASSYLAAGMGGLVLCAKPDECARWQEWAAATDRTKDLIIINKSGQWRFNFLEWEASRLGAGGGLSINIVALLDEIAGAIASSGSKDEGGDSKFFQDALHHMNTNLVELPILAGIPVSLPLMRAIVTSAPQTLKEAEEAHWQETSICAAVIREADQATEDGDPEARADFEECRNYWLKEYPALSEKTRSIITLSFSMLVQPFITRPLKKLLAGETNITPEAAFDGKILIIDLPIQEYRLAGRVAQLAWKYCFQVAVLRRTPPSDGSYLRPVFLWADECQNFITEFDAEYQAVARSAGGCSVFLVQNRESMLRVLGSAAAVDSLLGNLQAKFLCQNSSPDTNEWAAKLLGERWISVTSQNINRGSSDESGRSTSGSGVTVSDQRRFFVEPAEFATLKRGGANYGYLVEAIVYKGGHQFPALIDGVEADLMPFTRLLFHQQK